MIFVENMTDVDQIVHNLTGRYFSEESIWIGIIASSVILISIVLFGIYKKYTFKMNKQSLSFTSFKDYNQNVFTGYIKGVSKSGYLNVLVEDNKHKYFDLKEVELMY